MCPCVFTRSDFSPPSACERLLFGFRATREMLLLWITFSLTWTGTTSFTVHSMKEGVCLEDSPEGGIELKACSLDLDLQQWMWADHGVLLNAGTRRCLSAIHTHPVQTTACDSGEHVKWQCKSQQLIGLRNGLMLSTERGKLTLSRAGQEPWKSLDATNICSNKLRSRRESHLETEEFDFAEATPVQRMTEAQMKFLQWYYRTEDPTSWKFGMLAFSFLGLLMGAVLMVVGMMANRNRKQIAKYKADSKVPAVKPEMEELQVIIADCKQEKPHCIPSQHSREWEPSADSNSSEELKPGEIVVRWKDGNVSTLYPEPVMEGEGEEDVQNTDEENLSQNCPQVIASSEAIAF